jgi:hypothetical protein
MWTFFNVHKYCIADLYPDAFNIAAAFLNLPTVSGKAFCPLLRPCMISCHHVQWVLWELLELAASLSRS